MVLSTHGSTVCCCLILLVLDMPESILVRFKGEMKPGITLRDLVHAIPYYGIQQGLLTVEKAGKINEFSGRVLEIEGVEHLSVGTVKLSQASIEEYLNSNITMLKWMIAEGYGDRRTIERNLFFAHQTILMMLVCYRMCKVHRSMKSLSVLV